MPPHAAPPRIGMRVRVRNRRGLITRVEPYPPEAQPASRLHLIRIAYADPDGPPEDALIWEREVDAALLDAWDLPDPLGMPPMHPRDLEATRRAAQWRALTPHPELIDLPDDLPLLTAPFFSAFPVEDYQLVPLHRALTMPRVAMLLADGVGLGKTLECGLILRELMTRRQIRRVLVLCPAALRLQWQQEFQESLALRFELIDRLSTQALRKQHGLGANPWTLHSKAIVSYQYLRQPEVLEAFRQAAEPSQDHPERTWDLLIVDEAHNLCPGGFGPDSELSRLLRRISPWFEHRVFLSATPHNGHTRSFSGLLEALDPSRFSRTSSIPPDAKSRIAQVVVRRLKSDLNRPGRAPRFSERRVEALPDLVFGPRESRLLTAFDAFRRAVRRHVRHVARSEASAGAFALEVLSKRLLSGPATFAESWWRCIEGLESMTSARAEDVQVVGASSQADLEDDAEREARTSHAVTVVGAWLSTMARSLEGPMRDVSRALEALALGRDHREVPNEDVRYETLKAWCSRHLIHHGHWRDDERLILFTEFKTTLDLVARRLARDFDAFGPGAIRVLYGGMADSERQEIKRAFNDPLDALRVLVATDAASEGLNLQRTCRSLLHWDIPWNPSRMEQRNGRLDRHGQARDVAIYHFSSSDDASLRFMGRLLGKRSRIRDDQIMADPLFSEAIMAHFASDSLDTDLLLQLDLALSNAPTPDELPLTAYDDTAETLQLSLSRLADRLDLFPSTLRETMAVALEHGMQLPVPLSSLIFDPRQWIDDSSGRPVFRPVRDQTLIHLGHPYLEQALNALARARSRPERFSRWSTHRGPLPAGLDAVLLLTVEETALNALLEPLHHWVRTWCFTLEGQTLSPPVENLLLEPPAAPWRGDPGAIHPRTIEPGVSDSGVVDPGLVAAARAAWTVASGTLARFVEQQARTLSQALEKRLATDLAGAIADEDSRCRQRLDEIHRSMRENTLAKLERERNAFLDAMRQLTFLAEIDRAREQKLADLTSELALRRHHSQELREQIQAERDRLVHHVLPARYRLHGPLHVLPLALEIRFPEN